MTHNKINNEIDPYDDSEAEDINKAYNELITVLNAYPSYLKESDDVQTRQQKRVLRGKLLLRLLTTIGHGEVYDWLIDAEPEGIFLRIQDFLIAKRNTLTKDSIGIKEIKSTIDMGDRVIEQCSQLSQAHANTVGLEFQEFIDKATASCQDYWSSGQFKSCSNFGGTKTRYCKICTRAENSTMAQPFDRLEYLKHFKSWFENEGHSYVDLFPAIIQLLSAKMANIIEKPKIQCGRVYNQQREELPGISLLNIYQSVNNCSETDAIEELADKFKIPAEIFDEVKIDGRTGWTYRTQKRTWPDNYEQKDGYEHIYFCRRDQLLGKVIIDDKGIVAPVTFWSNSHKTDAIPLDIPFPKPYPLWNTDLLQQDRNKDVVLFDSLFMAWQGHNRSLVTQKIVETQIQHLELKKNDLSIFRLEKDYELKIKDQIKKELKLNTPKDSIETIGWQDLELHAWESITGYTIIDSKDEDEFNAMYELTREISLSKDLKFNFEKGSNSAGDKNDDEIIYSKLKELILAKKADVLNLKSFYKRMDFLKGLRTYRAKLATAQPMPPKCATPDEMSLFQQIFLFIQNEISIIRKGYESRIQYLKSKLENNDYEFTPTSWYGGKDAAFDVDWNSGLRDRNVYYVLSQSGHDGYLAALRAYSKIKDIKNVKIEFIDHTQIILQEIIDAATFFYEENISCSDSGDENSGGHKIIGPKTYFAKREKLNIICGQALENTYRLELKFPKIDFFAFLDATSELKTQYKRKKIEIAVKVNYNSEKNTDAFKLQNSRAGIDLFISQSVTNHKDHLLTVGCDAFQFILNSGDPSLSGPFEIPNSQSGIALFVNTAVITQEDNIFVAGYSTFHLSQNSGELSSRRITPPLLLGRADILYNLNEKNILLQSRTYTSHDSVPDFFNDTQEIPEEKYILAPVIQERTSTLIYAEPGIGKTWVALSIAFSILYGTNTFGSGKRWSAEEPHKVLYIDSEMSSPSFLRRLKIIRKMYYSPQKDEIPFIYKLVASEGWDLSDEKGDCRSKVDKMLRIAEKAANGKKVELLILDNLSTLSGFNDFAQSWNNIFKWLKGLKENNCSSIVVHHCGKSGDQRGTSAKTATVDNVIRLKKINVSGKNKIGLEVSIEKGRDIHGDGLKPFNVELDLGAKNPSWREINPHKYSDDDRYDIVKSLCKFESITVADIASFVGLETKRVREIIRQKSRFTSKDADTNSGGGKRKINDAGDAAGDENASDEAEETDSDEN